MSTYKYKGSTIVVPFTINSNQPMYENTSVSLKIQRAAQVAQRWELSFTTVNTSETAADMLLGMIVDLHEVETMIMPQIVNNAFTGAPTVNSASAGATAISISNFGSVTGSWKKGEFIRFAGHSKVYIVTEDKEKDQSVTIFPALVAAVGVAETVYQDALVNFDHLRSLDNAAGITFTDGILSSPGTIVLLEDV
jgi:hypothetical protein